MAPKVGRGFGGKKLARKLFGGKPVKVGAKGVFLPVVWRGDEDTLNPGVGVMDVTAAGRL